MTGPDDPAFDAYKTLQVDPEADPEVIQAAYRRLAQKWHPDVASGDEAEARMVAINRAWEILQEPSQRAEYDKERARRIRGARLRYSGRSDADRDTSWPSAEPAPNRAKPASPRHPGSAGSAGSGTRAPGPGADTPRANRPEEVSRDWTTGRSTVGSGYDPASMRTDDSEGGAGPPPGQPSGSIVNFGRYNGWSLGEIARTNLEFLEWLDRMPIGRPYRTEIDEILRRTGRRRSGAPDETDRRGLFRRR